MKIELCARVFADDNSHFWILGFLQRALAGRFFMNVRSPNADEYKAWLERQPKVVREAWAAVLNTATAYEAVVRMKVVSVDSIAVSDWSSGRLRIADAMLLVDAPFKIMVENARFDRAFFLCCLTPQERELVEAMEKEDRLLFYAGGGVGELHQLVLEHVADRPHKSLTHLVLFDSDAAAPGKISEVSRALGEDCARLGVRFHCLSRRAIENYLPKPALYDYLYTLKPSQRSKRKRRIEAFLGMSAPQRYHYRMKNGWPSAPSAEETQLYAGLPGDIVSTLSAGISPRLSEHFRSAGQERLRQQMAADGGVAELRPFIDDLIKLIRAPNG